MIRARAEAMVCVSVPSTGRSGLQRGSVKSMYTHGTSFSTLYGSKWVATASGAIRAWFATGFSTLYGSKWVATLVGQAMDTGIFGFSTLYGSKWVATFAVERPQKSVCAFQYPLRVEVGCNFFERLW